MSGHPPYTEDLTGPGRLHCGVSDPLVGAEHDGSRVSPGTSELGGEDLEAGAALRSRGGDAGGEGGADGDHSHLRAVPLAPARRPDRAGVRGSEMTYVSEQGFLLGVRWLAGYA